MGQHLEIAQQFIEEQRQLHPNLAGALLAGSVAGGTETASSDIDLRLVFQPESGTPLDRQGLDSWRSDIYIDALPVKWADYTDTERVLAHPIWANDMNSGRILYDPTGQLAQVQLETQAHFMETGYIARRVQPLYKQVNPWITNLQQAIIAKQLPSACFYAGKLVFSLGLIPLIAHGIAPSSTRHLRQLGQLAPNLRDQLCELEGSAQMDQAKLSECHRIFTRLSNICDTSMWGHLPEYVVKKTGWMIEHDYQPEAIHAMWINASFRVNDCRQSRDSHMPEITERLVYGWFSLTGWTGQEVQQAKWQQINQIWEEVKTHLSHLELPG